MIHRTNQDGFVRNYSYGTWLGKQAPGQNAPQGTKSPEQIHREQQRKDLQLSRTRIVNELASATHPNHRKSLEAALAHLDKKLSELA